MTALLAVRGVKTFYGRVMALKGVDLEVKQGEIVTLIGANGAGKSTLMMTICGNPRARTGSIVFDGTEITNLPTHEIMRRDIAQAPEGRRGGPGGAGRGGRRGGGAGGGGGGGAAGRGRGGARGPGRARRAQQ